MTIAASGNVGIGSTTPFYKLSVEGDSSFANNVRANYFTATSSVASTFPYASTTALTVSGTNGLKLSTSLNGLLQSVAGLVTSTSTLSISYGGTGLSTAPSYGQLLLGQTNGTYALTATSSLGLTNTTIQHTYGTAQSGAITFATSSQNTNGLSFGLNITNSGSTFTLTATSSGLLQAAGGGTGISNPSAAGILLGSYAGGGWQQLATSSLNITSNLANVTGTLGVANGGTGGTSFGQGWIYSNGATGALAASTSPTVNYITATSTTATNIFAGNVNILSNKALYFGASENGGKHI